MTLQIMTKNKQQSPNLRMPIERYKNVLNYKHSHNKGR